MRPVNRRRTGVPLLVVLLLGASAAAPATARVTSGLTIPPGRATPSALLQPPASAAAPSPLASATPSFGSGSARENGASVGTGPSTLAVNPATHTIYVANGYNDNGPQLPAPGNTVSVIDSRHCNARDVSRCKGPWPTITVGNMPSGIAIDEQTDTIYVSNVMDNTVSVFNGATCNAQDSTGCGQTATTVPVGLDPLGLLVDPANHTVYVPDFGALAVGGSPDSTTLSMIDSATCNATDHSGCPHTAAPTVDLGSSPDAVAAAQTTHTVYVATLAATMAFDADTCNATVQSGCGTIATLALGDPNGGPNGLHVDSANDTLYTANYDNTVSAFDLHDCNASDLAGCATDAPGTVTVPAAGFDHALWLAVDPSLRSVFVVFQKNDALKVVDTDLCSGGDPSGCATLIPSEIHTGQDPESVALDPQTQTLYTANWVDNTASVIDASRCDTQTTSGCRKHVPEVPIAAAGLAADPAVATTYVATGFGTSTVSMIDTRTCNAHRPAACGATPPSVSVGTNPRAVAVDSATHSVYVADGGAGATGTVSVFDERTCNASHHAGCGAVSMLQVPGGNPDDIAVNAKTDTVYVATITSGDSNLISVFNGATCNATNTVGCQQTPATLSVGDSANGASVLNLAINPLTNTVYATNVIVDTVPFMGNSVYAINGAICDATNSTGCGQTPATVTIAANPPIGSNPWGIAVDQATNTIYTANIADGEHPGTVSVINGAICDGQNTSGCGQTPATAPAGFGTVGITLDPKTDRVYATNTEDTSVTTINGNTCNSAKTKGCQTTRTRPIVGDYPGSISVDSAVDTAYVADGEGVSVMPLTP